jgi:hypothetical protein
VGPRPPQIERGEEATIDAVARYIKALGRRLGLIASLGELTLTVTTTETAFASERDIVLAFVLKKNLPAGGGQAAALAKILDRWAQDHPEPYLGHHWPAT